MVRAGKPKPLTESINQSIHHLELDEPEVVYDSREDEAEKPMREMEISKEV
jgi:hypothetical protein